MNTNLKSQTMFLFSVTLTAVRYALATYTRERRSFTAVPLVSRSCHSM